MQPMAALHMRKHIKPGVSLPEEDIIVLHLLSLSIYPENILSTKSIQAKIFIAK
jgi:hypothetical protein